MLDRNLIVGLLVLGVLVLAVYAYAPKLRQLMSGVEGFASKKKAVQLVEKKSVGRMQPVRRGSTQQVAMVSERLPVAVAAAASIDKFADYADMDESLGPVPTAPGAQPQGCYPRKQLNAHELLPQDQNQAWASANPSGAGDIQGKNFLSAGALIGVNTVGQSLRNSNLQLRSEPSNPQVQVGPWLQSTIEPDLSRRPLE